MVRLVALSFRFWRNTRGLRIWRSRDYSSMINRTHAFIDTDALQHNLQRVQQIAPNMPIIAMVKANAYGHGVEQIAHGFALKVAGFGVACLSEARQLRLLIPHAPIL